MVQHITVIGAGAIGRAIEHVLRHKPEITWEFWDTDTSKVSHQKELQDSVPSADVIFLCIPSYAIREALTLIVPLLSSQTICVSLAKGIEATSCHTIDAVLTEMLSENQPYGVLGGPMLAGELTQDMHGEGVIGTSMPKVARVMRELFQDTKLGIVSSDDPRGVALAGVIKNIYAVGIGIADGLQCGNNEKGILITHAVTEMVEILQSLGCDPVIAYGPAGLADMVATGLSTHSRNHRIGMTRAMDVNDTKESEGTRALPLLRTLIAPHHLELPFYTAIESIVQDRHNPREVMTALFRTS